MAVETLSIIGGPLAGLAMNLAMNGGMSGIQTWMVGHGIRPSHVVIGAIIGALIRGDVLGGAIRGALVVGGVEAGYYYLAR